MPNTNVVQAAEAALVLQEALLAAIHGDINWEQLERAVARAVELGCATQADLEDIRARSLTVDRLWQIRNCLAPRTNTIKQL